MIRIKSHDLVYVGTPYSNYPGGIEIAFIEACRVTARLLQEGAKVYSPIAHTHPVAIHGKIDPLDHNVWLPFDAAIMSKSDAMIVVKMDSWERSKGIAHEIDVFTEARKPIYFIEPDTLRVDTVMEFA
jgi:hypothetical protein